MPRHSYCEADLPVQLSEYFAKTVRYTNVVKLFKLLKKFEGAVVNIVQETVLLRIDPLDPLSPLEPGNTLSIVVPAETTEKMIHSFFHDINTTCSFLQARIAPERNLFPDKYSQCSYTYCVKPHDNQTCFRTTFHLLREGVLIDRYVQSKIFDFEQLSHDGTSFFGYSAVAVSDYSGHVTGFSEWMLQTPITTFIDNLKSVVTNHMLFGLRLSDTAVAHIVRRLDVALSYQLDFLSVTTSFEKMKVELSRDCPAGSDVDALYKIPSLVWDNEVFMIRFYSGGVQCVYGLNRRGVQHQAQRYLLDKSRDRLLEDQIPSSARGSMRDRKSVRTWPGTTQMEMERHTYSYHTIPGMLEGTTIRHAGSGFQ